MPPHQSASYAVPAVESANALWVTRGDAQPLTLPERSKKRALGNGFRTASIHVVESAHPRHIHMRIGGEWAHATSTGTVLFAALPPEDLTLRLFGQRLATAYESYHQEPLGAGAVS